MSTTKQLTTGFELLTPYLSSGYVFGGEEPFQSWNYDKLMRRLKSASTFTAQRHIYFVMPT